MPVSFAIKNAETISADNVVAVCHTDTLTYNLSLIKSSEHFKCMYLVKLHYCHVIQTKPFNCSKTKDCVYALVRKRKLICGFHL